MDKILIAIKSNDEKEISKCITELKELNFEVLQTLLKLSSSKNLSDYIRTEFYKQLKFRDEPILNELAEELKIISTENIRNENESIDLDQYEDLTESEALKKHSFNNSKFDKALEMFIGSFKSNINDINFDKAAILSKAIVEHLKNEFLSTFPKEVRSKSHNLRENPKLCTMVYNTEIGIDEFVKMLPSEMQCEELKSKDTEYIKESLLASQVATTAADTDMFRCSKCKQNKCTYSQLQTRSCDEAMTTFVTCTNCGHRWKF